MAGFVPAIHEHRAVFLGRLAGIPRRRRLPTRDGGGTAPGFREAVDGYLEICAKFGKTPLKPYSGQIMVWGDPQVHADAALVAELAGKSLAKWTEEKLRDASARERRAG